jgi:hypothetical protein
VVKKDSPILSNTGPDLPIFAAVGVGGSNSIPWKHKPPGRQGDLVLAARASVSRHRTLKQSDFLNQSPLSV